MLAMVSSLLPSSSCNVPFLCKLNLSATQEYVILIYPSCGTLCSRYLSATKQERPEPLNVPRRPSFHQCSRSRNRRSEDARTYHHSLVHKFVRLSPCPFHYPLTRPPSPTETPNCYQQSLTAGETWQNSVQLCLNL